MIILSYITCIYLYLLNLFGLLLVYYFLLILRGEAFWCLFLALLRRNVSFGFAFILFFIVFIWNKNRLLKIWYFIILIWKFGIFFCVLCWKIQNVFTIFFWLYLYGSRRFDLFNVFNFVGNSQWRTIRIRI